MFFVFCYSIGVCKEREESIHLRKKLVFGITVFGLAGSLFWHTVMAAPTTPVDSFKTVGNAEQVILVTTDGYNTYQAKIETYEKKNGRWIKQLSVSGAIGKNGFAKSKKEGDMKSPRGKYTISLSFGRYQNPGTKLRYRKITEKDVWVDDSKSIYYNTWQQKPAKGRWQSAEEMDVAPYDYGFVIDYNTKRIPNKGSAIFFHVIGQSGYTAGCTAASKEDVVNIVKWLDPNKHPIIIQSPKNELEKY
jgi:L,D-peptidoglycan transpeptidase YkuD (ErfK/YbiS/YcfS/YnhG family)